MLRRSPGLTRLLLVKLIGQFGDGMFQSALGGAILFNPERHADPAAIAAGFAVLLLPYSVIGPFAGALLDRWDRRAVLLWAGLLRAGFILATAVLLGVGASTDGVLLLALAAVGVSRFVAAGVSAALPRVVEPRLLVVTNSVLATVGSGCAAVGAAGSVLILSLAGSSDVSSAVAVTISSAGTLVSALAAAGFTRRVLGPDEPGSTRVAAALRAVAAGLGRGAVAVWRSPGVTAVMTGIGAHRIVFGVDTLVMVLILRGPTAPGTELPSGLAGFGVAVSAAAAGMLVAAVVTPMVIPLIGRTRTVVVGLVVALAVQWGLVVSLTHAKLLAAAFLLGLAGQVIKLTGDAAMQIEIPDIRRGQVFALQDTVFNAAFVLSIAVAASLLPPDGRSVAVVFAAGGCYALALVAIGLNSLRADAGASGGRLGER
ncbi:MFS transporter [Rhodococcus sp. D2-41]|uniref:MFS transporter n=1 Tax=Speluncibacter jeojiensis TaxID=2710754 RepID=A0A9X4RDF7_9ACTN|nr:MFS transporter [Rhodococcus sp. D2-41]MDG3009807.1 MFS transporter [Rhodococcus sp. D2-41]MDG3014558.1 hypothetical protein [Corynebacteriales bacterium D3-21]